MQSFDDFIGELNEKFPIVTGRGVRESKRRRKLEWDAYYLEKSLSNGFRIPEKLFDGKILVKNDPEEFHG